MLLIIILSYLLWTTVAPWWLWSIFSVYIVMRIIKMFADFYIFCAKHCN